MRATDLSRWHWMIVGVVLGLIGGSVRSACTNFADELASFDALRLGQRDFERALAARFQGRPGFTHLTIQPYRLNSDAGAVTLHVVRGLYCDGQPTEANGRRVLQWTPAYFVASVPFRPVATPAASPSFDDVFGYLNATRVPYRYASWWWATRPPFVWTCAGFLIVGVIWPTVVNLLAYGTVTRPPELDAAPLPKPAAAAAIPPKVPEVDLQALHDLDRQLEERLLRGASSAAEPTAVAAAAATPRVLTIEPLQASDASHAPHKEFGVKREDYYPTELSAKHDT